MSSCTPLSRRVPRRALLALACLVKVPTGQARLSFQPTGSTITAVLSPLRACPGFFRPGLLVLALGSAVPLPGAPALSPAITIPAGQHMTDGQNRTATDALDAAAEKVSRAAALYADALIGFENRQFEPAKALDELKQVTTLDPANDQAQLLSANILLQTGQIEAAYEQLDSVAKRGQPSAALEAMLGYTQHLRGQNEDAQRLSTHALASDPKQAVPMRVLLEIAASQDDLAGAVVHIEDVFKQGGSTVPAEAWVTLGRLYLEVARQNANSLSGDAALRTLLPIYRQAAAKFPPDTERLTLLAGTYQDLGENEAALRTLRAALQLEPDNVDLLLRCGRLEMTLEDKTSALRDFEKAYELNPALNGLREMLARTYLDADQFDDAIRLLKEALAEVPDSPAVDADLGLAYEGLHDPATAMTYFNRAFASPTCPAEAYLKLAVFQINAGALRLATHTLATARARFPNSALVLFYQAIEHRSAGKYDAALACLDGMRALSAGGDDVFDPSYYLESSLVLSLAGKSARIEPVLREGLAKFPNNPDLMNELAFSSAEAGTNLDEALSLARRAVQINPANGAMQDTLGWVLFKRRDANLALPYLQRAAVLTKNDAVVLEHLGEAWLHLGHPRQAIVAWHLALRRKPSDHDLVTRINAEMAQANHADTRSAPHK